MPGINYSDAGVDVDAGERAVELMRASVARTMRREVVGGLGGFAGLFDISRYTGMQQPLLATSTDGVGTKIAVARAMGIHNTVGIDLVAMVVDDLVVCGAEPLFLTDYIATGSVDQDRPRRVRSPWRPFRDACDSSRSSRWSRRPSRRSRSQYRPAT